MIGLRDVLEVLLGQAEQNPLQVSLPVRRYVNTRADVAEADLSTLQPLLTTYLAQVQPRHDELVASGLFERLRVLVAIEAGFLADPTRPRPDPKLPQASAGDPGRRLRVPPIGASGSELGFALLTGQQSVDSLNLVDARRAVAELRNADNVCIRVLAARRAALRLGLPVAEVLALYRTEGDLQVPVSLPSVDQLIPSTEPSPATSLAETGPLIRQMVFLAKATELQKGKLAAEAASRAMEVWLLQLAGLDHLSRRIFPLALTPKLLPQLARFSAANAARVPAVATLDGLVGATQRWQSLDAGLRAFLVRPHADGSREAMSISPSEPDLEADDAVLVAPADPVDFVARVLAEGAAYLRRLGTADDVLMSDGDTPGPDDPDPPALPAGHPLRGEFLGHGLAYFRYNLQVGARTGSPYQAGMISAVANAAASTNPVYQELRDAINGSDQLREIARQLDFITGEKDAALIKDLWWANYLAPALRDPVHPERARLLAQFVATATTADWSRRSFARPRPGGKGSPRGNASRYQQLLNFYSRI
jgi:hypothetical protein